MSQPSLTGHAYLRNYKVLVVDDEPLNLEVFQYNFGDDFTLRVAGSADEALQILRTENIAAVVADHRMPGMTGLDLLTWLAEHQPRVVRILLTAHTHVGLLLDAVNRGVLFRYVPKPWDAESMRQDMLLAIQRHRMEADVDRVKRQSEQEARLAGARLVATALAADLGPAVTELAGLSAHTPEVSAPLRRIAKVVESLRESERSHSLALTPASLSHLSAHACDAIAEAATEAQIDVHRHFPDGLPDVQVDVSQAVSAITALLQNALQATRGSSAARVGIRTSRTATGVRVTVSDNGAGLGPKSASLFLPFVSRRPGAAGLGLALVRAVALSHGGRCHLGEDAAGTHAWLEFPAA